MYKEFLKLLEKATGHSEYVIAVNLDIRGFTSFCQRVESLQVATYITKIYSKIIDDYFKNASFYKPAGDGLIIIIPFSAETLEKVARDTINSCLNLLKNFGSLCKDEHMVNFPTPDKIGIGLTRGSTCCIFVKDENKILDYSGRILNLASRLMDLARPSGVVFDESFSVKLLSKETKELFSDETGYVRGVAEETPIKVYYTKKYTLLPKSFKQPLKEPKWNTDTFNIPFEKLKKVMTKEFGLFLTKKPLDESKISVTLIHEDPSTEGFFQTHEYSIDDKEIYYERKGNSHTVIFDIHKINKSIEGAGATKNMNIKIQIIYPIK